MTDVSATPFARLEASGSLVNPHLKAATHVEGRFGYRGDISFDGPDTVIKEVFAVAQCGQTAIEFLAGSVEAYRSIPKIIAHFGDTLDASGRYFLYVLDVPRDTRWYVCVNDIKFFVVFIDDASVYDELITAFEVDKHKLKKLDTSAKLDALADVGIAYGAQGYEEIPFEEGLLRLAAKSLQDRAEPA